MGVPFEVPVEKKLKKKKIKTVEVDPSATPETAAEEVPMVDVEKKKKKKKKVAVEENITEDIKEEQAEGEQELKKKKKKRNREEAVVEKVEAEPEEGKKQKKEKKMSSDAVATPTTNADEKANNKKVVKTFALQPASSKDDLNWYKENNVNITDSQAPIPATSFNASTGLATEYTDILKNKFGKDGKPSLIQAVAWPLMMAGKDVFGIAKTGSGKTLAFLLPFLSLNEKRAKNRPQPRMVCVAPTKELAQQIAAVGEEFAGAAFPVCCVIGGVRKGDQIAMLQRGCDICVATPGRLLDLVENDQAMTLAKCNMLVLDEADRMLDMGFIQDMRKISDYCGDKETRQTVLFSATWPLEVNKLARGLIKKGKEVATITVLRKDASGVDANGDVNTEDKLQLNDAISQDIKVLEDGRRKWNLLQDVLQKEKGKKILIFGLYKKEVANLETWLNGAGTNCVALQGDMAQYARTQAIEDYKANKVRVLVATDVAARGLDIPDIDVVINYTFPLTIEDFVHRIGRTGRAGRKGRAVTFFNKTGEHKEREHVFDLVRLLEGAKQPVPAALQEVNKNTFTATKKKSHGMYGDFFKSEEEMARLEKNKKQVTFDSDSD